MLAIDNAGLLDVAGQDTPVQWVPLDRTIDVRVTAGQLVAGFVGDNWTCETGNDTNSYINDGTPYYLSDVLWDADGDAHGPGCERVTDPGWFEVRLPAPTTAQIEVRIMASSCDDKVTLTDLILEVR